MRISWIAWAVLVLSISAAASGPPVLEPVLQGDKVEQELHEGKTYPVFRDAADRKLVAAIDRVFSSSFAGNMLVLDRLSRSVRQDKNRQAGLPSTPELLAPVYLLLSQEDGGYARHDFFLQTADGKRAFVAADYVDLVVDDESVANGDFEEIFSHELGHVILRNLIGKLVGPRSNKMHQSMTLTDYRTAFDEGFAEHFQIVARDNSTNPSLLGAQRGELAQPLNQEFLSQRDQLLRNFGTRMDHFIHDRMVPACTSVRDCYVLEETSTAFDPAQMRTGQQMLSSEGVIATAFYHLVSQEAPSGCTRDPDHTIDCSALNKSYQKVFEALAEVVPDMTRSPLIAMLEQYRKKFLHEGEAAIADFVLMTRGVTVSLDALHRTEALDRASAHADIAGFRNQLHALRDLMKSTTADVVANRVKLDAAVGPELWIRNEAFVHSSLWDPTEEEPLRINLNTASAEELTTMPRFSPATAQALVAERKKRGCFESIDQIAEALQLNQEQARALQKAAASFATAKEDPIR